MGRHTGFASYVSAVTSTALVLGASFAVADESSSNDKPVAQRAPVAAARDALTMLRDDATHSGLKLQPQATSETPLSHRIVLEASPFQLALYTDRETWLAPRSTATGWTYGGQPASFAEVFVAVPLRDPTHGTSSPTRSADDYFERWLKLGERASTQPRHLRRDAEVVLYTLDGNGDGRVDAADRNAAPARATVHNHDLALLRICFGTAIVEGAATDQQKTEVVAQGVRVWIDARDTFASGQKPRPLFLYRLSEQLAHFDLDGDGTQEGELLFGDADGDGQVNDTENEVLLATAARGRPDLADALDADRRFAPDTTTTPPRAGLLERLRQAHPNWTDEERRQFVHNAIVRVDVRLLLEFDDEARQARIRKRLFGHADFRNALIRLRGLTP